MSERTIEVLPAHPERNPFRAYIDILCETALIQPPINAQPVLEVVSGDVGVIMTQEVATQYGTVVNYYYDEGIWPDGIERAYNMTRQEALKHTFQSLLNRVGATVSKQCFEDSHES